MAEENSLEIFHDVIEASIEFLYDEYKKKYFEGCGKSLSCHDICPIGLPVEELLVRSNAAAVWGK